MIAALLDYATVAPVLVDWLSIQASKARLKKLATRSRWRYSAHVPEKKGAEFDSSNTQSGLTAQRGFFTSVYSWYSFNGGLGGEAFGLAGGFVCRSVNPIQFRHPHLTVGGGFIAHKGGHMPGTATSKKSRNDALIQLAGKAGCVSALLAVLDLLPEAEQRRAIKSCTALAGELYSQLTADSVLRGDA